MPQSPSPTLSSVLKRSYWSAANARVVLCRQSGRVKLTCPKLDSISKWLSVTPEVLVDGTGFVGLVTSAPPSPERERIAELERHRDELRAQRAELEAQVRQLNEALKARDADVARMQAEVETARIDAGRVSAENQQLPQELAHTHAEALKKDRRWARANRSCGA